MNTTSVSMTDDVVREIGEQVSLVLRRHFPKIGGSSLGLTNGIRLYQAHLGMSVSSAEVCIQDASQSAPNEVGVYVVKHKGDVVYVGRAIEDRPNQSIKGLRKRIREHARGAGTSSEKLDDYRNDKDTTVEFHTTGSADAAKNLEAKLIGKHRPKLNKRKETHDSTRIVKDASKRITGNIIGGIASDVAVFSCGGAAWEIRDAYRNPDALSLLERCERLIVAIWERIKTTLKGRSLREVGSEFVTGVASVLAAPLKMATDAIEKIVSVLRRLWMDFVDGRIKSLADLIAACLKALLVIASAGVALLLEKELSPFMSAIPGGDVLAAVIAAVVAGVMIVIGNRSIDGVVRALFGMFNAGTIARLRREEIQRMCEEGIPRLIEERERLQALVDSHFAERETMLDATFDDMQSARRNHDFNGFLKSLITLNQAYGKVLLWGSIEEFDEFMLDDSRTLKF